MATDLLRRAAQICAFPFRQLSSRQEDLSVPVSTKPQVKVINVFTTIHFNEEENNRNVKILKVPRFDGNVAGFVEMSFIEYDGVLTRGILIKLRDRQPDREVFFIFVPQKLSTEVNQIQTAAGQLEVDLLEERRIYRLSMPNVSFSVMLRFNEIGCSDITGLPVMASLQIITGNPVRKERDK